MAQKLQVEMQASFEHFVKWRRAALARMWRALDPYWLKTQLFNFWASCKVVYSESFNFYFLGFWASKDPTPHCLRRHNHLNLFFFGFRPKLKSMAYFQTPSSVQ